MRIALFLLLSTSTILLEKQSAFSQTLWNTNLKHERNQPSIDMGIIQKTPFTTPIIDTVKKNNPFSWNRSEINSVLKDSGKSIEYFFDSTYGKPKTGNDSLLKNNFVNILTHLGKEDNNLNYTRNLSNRSIDSLLGTSMFSSLATKINKLTDSVNIYNIAEYKRDSAKRADSLIKVRDSWLSASQYASNKPTQLNAYLQIFTKGDTAVTNQFKNLNSDNPATKDIAYILLALQDSLDIKQYFKSLRNLGGHILDSEDIQMKMNYIKDVVSKLIPKDKDHFSLLASGDFLSTVQSSTIGSNNSILSGTLGVSYIHKNTSLIGKIILASTQDTVINNYGSQILVPAKGKGFGTWIAGVCQTINWSKDSLRTWNLNLVGAVSTQHWRLDSSQLNNLDSINAKMDNTFIESATIAGIDFTLSHGVGIEDSIPVGNNKYALSFSYNLGVGERLLGGDVLKPLENKSSILYKTKYYANRFPTTRTAFFGFEAGAIISVGPIMAEFEVYYLPSSPKDKQPLYGLTGLQVAFGASINLNLYHK